MKLGCQSAPTNDTHLKYLARYGVRNICGYPEIAGDRIYATVDFSFVNIDQAFQAILNDLPNQPGLHQVSFTLSLGENLVSPTQVQTDAQYFASMAAQGLSIFVASGDSGSEEGGTTEVNYFAADPSVTAVGGTTLMLLGHGTSPPVMGTAELSARAVASILRTLGRASNA